MSSNLTRTIFAYLSSNVSLQLLNLASTFMIMSSLSLDDYGTFAYILEMMLLVSLLPELGTKTFYVKKLSGSKNMLSSARGVYGLHASLCIFALVLILVASELLKSDFLITFLVGLGFLLTVLFTPNQAYALASENALIVTLKEQVQGGSKFLFILSGYLFYPKVEYFIFFPYFQALCLTIFWAWSSKYNILPSLTWIYKSNTRGAKKDLINLIPFTFLIVINLVYNKIDIYMLGHLDGINSVGLYVASTKFIYPFMFISSVFMNAVFPRMVKKETRVDALSYAIKYLPLLGIIISVFLLISSDFIFHYFDGGKYYDAILSFRVLVFYLPIVFTYGVLTNYLVSIGKINFLVCVNSVGLVINVALNYVMIPKWAHFGAAISTIICEVLIFIIVLVYFQLGKKRFVEGN